MTCISPQVVQAVGLQSMGMRQMVSATQTIPVNLYLVDLLLPFGSAGLFQQGIQVMEFQAPGTHPFQMLLGRDILSGCVYDEFRWTFYVLFIILSNLHVSLLIIRNPYI